MSYRDLMKDPSHAPILYLIEEALCDADRAARQAGLSVTDSQVNSVVNKALSYYTGKEPKLVEPATERDRLLRTAYNTITSLHKSLKLHDGDTDEVLPVSQVKRYILRSLKTVRLSINDRKSPGSGSRSYLDFLEDFLSQSELQVIEDEE